MSWKHLLCIYYVIVMWPARFKWKCLVIIRRGRRQNCFFLQVIREKIITLIFDNKQKSKQSSCKISFCVKNCQWNAASDINRQKLKSVLFIACALCHTKFVMSSTEWIACPYLWQSVEITLWDDLFIMLIVPASHQKSKIYTGDCKQKAKNIPTLFLGGVY